MLKLAKSDLTNISLGLFSKVALWPSQDFAPDRIVIPNSSYLFIDTVDFMEGNRIKYTCRPSLCPLFDGFDIVPPGVILEFFQGYMVLADFMGCAKSKVPLIHRVLGGRISYKAPLPKVNDTCLCDITIKHVRTLGKTKLIEYSGTLCVNDQVILEVSDFKGIFYAADTQNGTSTKTLEVIDEEPTRKILVNSPLGTLSKIDVYKDIVRGFKTITPQDWFFPCHFVNDPCMPGSLVLQGVFDVCQNYFGSYAPKPLHTMVVSAKNHVLPTHKELVYNLYVREKAADAVQFDFDVFVDGKLAFLGQSAEVLC